MRRLCLRCHPALGYPARTHPAPGDRLRQGHLTLAAAGDPIDPYTANTLGLTHIAARGCAEVARIHIGRHRYEDDEVYRMLGSLHEGLGAMIKHRLLTPPAEDAIQ